MTIEEAKASIGAQLQQQALNTVVAELAKALVEIETTKAKLVTALAENETLLKEKIESQKAQLAAQAKINAELDAKMAAQVDAVLDRAANAP